MEFQNHYTKLVDPVLDCKKPSLVQSQYRSECDINCIMQAYGIDDVRGFDNSIMPYNDEVNDATVFNSDPIKVHEIITTARTEFEKLPRNIQYACGNDPLRFPAFLASDMGRAYVSDIQARANLQKPVVVQQSDI